MKQYWLSGLKKDEKAVYIGHITAEDKSYGIDNDMWEKINNIKKENDMTGLRFSFLRDLFDEYPCGHGSYFGTDVWLIVKSGFLKKNKSLIEQFKKVFSEDY